MALIGYARVSTAEQTLALQLDALRVAGCDPVFTDQASGAKADRPGLGEAVAYVRRGDTLVVWKLDRLGRSMAHLIETVRQLEAKGTGFRSLTEGVDTTTPGGTLVFHLFAALAQFERDLIRERTYAGLKAAEARGRKGGRKPVITPDKLARAKAHLARGLTVREAASPREGRQIGPLPGARRLGTRGERLKPSRPTALSVHAAHFLAVTPSSER